MQRSNSGLSAFLMLIGAVAIFGAVLWFNSSTTAPITPLIPTEQPPTESVSVGQLLDENFGSSVTQQPTVVLPQSQAVIPVVPQSSGPTATAISALDASNQVDTNNNAVGATPTLPPPTVNAPVQAGTLDPQDWNSPALVPPLSRDPEGRDHYWFRRPIESNANNRVLLSYTYGAGGFFNSRIHHGIDMPNPAGEEVVAPAPGEVVFASQGRADGTIDIFQNTVVYGNVVVIRHDFGYNGQPLYTLYAHLLAALVQEGDRVEAGDPIALVGDTGQVTGSHLHFEVRIGNPDGTVPRYGDTYNPTLWMVPYVGQGIVAGRVIDVNGDFIDNATVTIRNRFGVIASVPTYTFQNTVNDVNPDPLWRENFAVGDIAVGTYEVLVRIDGQLVIQEVEVFEGMTNFVQLQLEAPIQPTATESETVETNQSDG